jgi:hypothetical protein
MVLKLNHILVFLLLVFRMFCPLRCCWISLVRDRVSLVSVSGVSGTTSRSPGRSGGGISSGVLIWDLCSFLLPRFGGGWVGVAKSLSLSDMARGAALPKRIFCVESKMCVIKPSNNLFGFTLDKAVKLSGNWKSDLVCIYHVKRRMLPRLACRGEEPVSMSFKPFRVAFLFTPTDSGVCRDDNVSFTCLKTSSLNFMIAIQL